MEKTAEQWKELLCHQRKNGALACDDSHLQSANDFCEGYKQFLNTSCTEREATDYIITEAKSRGFKEFSKENSYQAGDKIYLNNRDKSVILAVIGKDDIKNGVNVIASHLDSPRLDLKQNPLYEASELAFFKTHYYGGIKKYQWGTVPLSLHGVIIKDDGEKVSVRIGDQQGDPVFCVNDLLVHLATEQMKRPSKDLLTGEELNILVGSLPFKDDKESERVKLAILKLLYEKYQITERDFISAELEMVPAFPASDVGFDRSMVGGYGQDDRVCAYTSAQAIFACENPGKTAVCVFGDKEETGSDGNTGLHSLFFSYFIEDLAAIFGTNARTILSNSACLSADVGAAFDPTFPDVLEQKNSAFFNYGALITKYTGSRGKGGTSDASAEFVDKITRLFDRENIKWQTGELGKVDAGGGGTVAMFLANLNMNVLDVGVPVLSMHSPFEITSKFDVYEAFRGYSCFLNAKD